jgi:hypothetical protein
MMASKPSAAFLRRMARLCQRAAGNGWGDAIAQKFTTLAADLEAKAVRIERDGGNGAA